MTSTSHMHVKRKTKASRIWSHYN